MRGRGGAARAARVGRRRDLRTGDGPPLTENDIVEPAMEEEDFYTGSDAWLVPCRWHGRRAARFDTRLRAAL